MRRRVFNWLTLLSLLLAVAVAGLWVRSVWWATDQVVWGRFGSGEWTVSAGSMGADIRVQWVALCWSGFRYYCWPPTGCVPSHWHVGPGLVVIPKWPMLIGFSILPACWFVSHHPARIRRKRLKLGLCGKCGYDMRASTSKCPECGTPIPAKPGQSPSGINSE